MYMYIVDWIYRPNPANFTEIVATGTELGNIWKKHGAERAMIFLLNGTNMGCIQFGLIFENAEAYGKASDTISADPDFMEKFGSFSSLGGEWIAQNLCRCIVDTG